MEEGRGTGHHKLFGRGRGGGKGPKHIGSQYLDLSRSRDLIIT